MKMICIIIKQDIKYIFTSKNHPNLIIMNLKKKFHNDYFIICIILKIKIILLIIMN